MKLITPDTEITCLTEEDAGLLKIEELFSKPLSIPTYQRPYSWDDEQVIDLMDDLLEAWKNNKKAYLVGNLIMYKADADSKWELVDGQQRTITFALICHVLELDVADKFLIDKGLSPLSIKRLKKNYELIHSRLGRLKENKKANDISFKDYFLDRIIVTYTIAHSQDEAFFYFDSQNTRGRALVRKDLLKVHHLREMFDNEQNDVIDLIAKKWEEKERINDGEDYLGKENDFLEFLFDQLLGLTRKSVRAELKAKELIKLDVYKEFLSEGGSKRLNNYNQPPLFDGYEYDVKKNMVRFTPKFAPFTAPYTLSDGAIYLPFEQTQSIEGGVSFFLYAFKYVGYLQKLRQDHPCFRVFDKINGAGNSYLRKIYRASLLFYYDKFGEELLDEFAMHLYLLLAYYRVQMGSIYTEGVVKFRWAEDKAWNPFKTIMLKYSPEHIIHSLTQYIEYYCKSDETLFKDLKGTAKHFYDAAEIAKIDEQLITLRNNIQQKLWS